jgi:hypothetical protein
VMPPQSVQVYWVFSLAMRQYYWINSQCLSFYESAVNKE